LAAAPRLAAAALVFLLLLAAPALAAPTFPALTGRVVDDAHILPDDVKASLQQKLAALEAKTQHQFVVVTLRDLQGYDIADYGYQLGRAWAIGRKGVNDGVLLIVAPREHKVRIEVGYGLEPVLTDALSNVILQTRVLPKFRAGDMTGGVVAGADAIIEQLGLDPAEAQQRAQAAASQAKPADLGFPVWLVALIIFWIALSVMRRRRRRLGAASALPWIILSSGWGGRGGGSGGGWSSGGGGGFSGGGGSFGGGGSSGSW
jgi:uncharacterized protein